MKCNQVKIVLLVLLAVDIAGTAIATTPTENTRFLMDRQTNMKYLSRKN